MDEVTSLHHTSTFPLWDSEVFLPEQHLCREILLQALRDATSRRRPNEKREAQTIRDQARAWLLARVGEAAHWRNYYCLAIGWEPQWFVRKAEEIINSGIDLSEIDYEGVPQ